MSRVGRVSTRVVGLLALLLSAAPVWAQDAGIAGVAKDTPARSCRALRLQQAVPHSLKKNV